MPWDLAAWLTNLFTGCCFFLSVCFLICLCYIFMHILKPETNTNKKFNRQDTLFFPFYSSQITCRICSIFYQLLSPLLSWKINSGGMIRNLLCLSSCHNPFKNIGIDEISQNLIDRSFFFAQHKVVQSIIYNLCSYTSTWLMPLKKFIWIIKQKEVLMEIMNSCFILNFAKL